MSLKIGFTAEQRARSYLKAQGLRWIESNYRCRWGEIDLIMRDKDYLVFVEVRARASNNFGGAIASVTYAKQQKLIKTATTYLVSKQLLGKHPIRFDVFGLDGTDLQINWIQNAFGQDF